MSYQLTAFKGRIELFGIQVIFVFKGKFFVIAEVRRSINLPRK